MNRMASFGAPPRDLVLGTAGHIDHGKTALVRALTGVDTDRLPAEKLRGITIDLGFAPLDLGPLQMAVVDVPGHERFIRNMVAGASGIDLAVLVVAADDSVMPQTCEHLEILRLLGIRGGLVALTKCDLADPGWLTMVEDDIRSLVRGSFLEGAPIVRTSAATGEGIGALKDALVGLAGRIGEPDDAGLFRLAIDRAFTVPGHGTVVTGTVASGTLAVGDELDWFPSGKTVRVRGLHRHDRPVERVGRGCRAALNLSGAHHSEVMRGHVLAGPGYLSKSTWLAVELRASTDALRPIRHRGRYKLHAGTSEVLATVALWDGSLLEPGETTFAQLLLAEPLATVHAEPFILREESPPATVGGGRVLRPTGRRFRRRDAIALDRLRRLASADPHARVSAVLAESGLKPWSESGLIRDTGLSPDQLQAVIGPMREQGELIDLPVGPRRTIRLTAERVAELEGRVARALARLHEASPRQTSIPVSHLAAGLPDLPGDALIAGLIDRLRQAGKVRLEGRSVALVGVKPRLSQGERALKQEMAEALAKGGSARPMPATWPRRPPGGPPSSPSCSPCSWPRRRPSRWGRDSTSTSTPPRCCTARSGTAWPTARP
ncbi:MAG: selenocysteine-specific translation elongation factor [Isosphaeraceae bacterium]